jgi:tetratricopeptide (TPR) repeat protein
VISSYPPAALDDPESVALQIYLASVTIFGQHGNSQRTEFSLPILSLGQTIISRVAFDSWPDPTLRGKERPFFLAFIYDESLVKNLSSHLDVFLFEYLDRLEIEGTQFSAQKVWNKIVESFSSLESHKEVDAITFEVDSDYAIPRAQKDLENARSAWEKLKDRKQLWVALRVANRLENVEDKGSGEAFSLVGKIFLEGHSFREAKEAFNKASEAFARVRLYEKSGENSYYAGKCSYHLGNLESAIELLQAGAIWIKDERLIASVNYDLGIALNEQNCFEEANTFFEKSIRIASGNDALLAAKFSSTYASKLMVQGEKEKQENPTYALGLIRRSAEQRIKSARFFQMSNEGHKEAATSYILAASAYFSLGNNEKGVTLLEEATNSFIDINDYISAARALYDGARTLKDQDRSYRLLERAEKLLLDQEIDIQRNRILGLILFEKAKIERKKSKILKSVKSYENSIKILKDSDSSLIDLVPIQIECANCLFRIEDFENAAKFFLAALEGLSTLPFSESLLEQQKKTQINALISLKRASIIYHNAGIVSLKRNEEEIALEVFSYSVSLLIDWIDNNIKENQKEVKKTIRDRLNNLMIKQDLFIQANSKYQLKKLIEKLNMAMESYNLLYN